MNGRLKFVTNNLQTEDAYSPLVKTGPGKVHEVLREVQRLKVKQWISILAYDEAKNYWKIVCIKEGNTSRVFELDKDDFATVIRKPEDAHKINEMLYDYMQLSDDIIGEVIRSSYE